MILTALTLPPRGIHWRPGWCCRTGSASAASGSAASWHAPRDNEDVATPLDQPALRAVEAPRPPDGPVLSEAMVMFLDGTWRLCKVAAWRQDPQRAWWCYLTWGVSGEIYGGWYGYEKHMFTGHDRERVRRLED